MVKVIEPDKSSPTDAELAALAHSQGPSTGPAPDDLAASAVLEGDGQLSPEGQAPALAVPDIPWSTLLEPIFEQASGMLEARSSRWAMTPPEIKGLSVAWGAVLDKYLPDSGVGVEALAVAATLAYAVPRYMADEHERAPRTLNPLPATIECEGCHLIFENELAYDNHLCAATG